MGKTGQHLQFPMQFLPPFSPWVMLGEPPNSQQNKATDSCKMQVGFKCPLAAGPFPGSIESAGFNP